MLFLKLVSEQSKTAFLASGAANDKVINVVNSKNVTTSLTNLERELVEYIGISFKKLF